MANENEQELELEKIENEEIDFEEEDLEPEETVIVNKKDFNKMQRKALAFDATKNQPVKVKKTVKTFQRDTPDYSAQIARLELKTDGYSDTEIDFINQNGGKTALDNPYVKKAVDAMREQAKAEAAVVTSESNKSDIERTYSPKEIDAMSFEELDKTLRSTK